MCVASWCLRGIIGIPHSPLSTSKFKAVGVSGVGGFKVCEFACSGVARSRGGAKESRSQVSMFRLEVPLTSESTSEETTAYIYTCPGERFGLVLATIPVLALHV